MDEISTPVSLDNVDSFRAVFVGTANETHTHKSIIGGDVDLELKFPMFAISREHWEALGMPVAFDLVAHNRSSHVLD